MWLHAIARWAAAVPMGHSPRPLAGPWVPRRRRRCVRRLTVGAICVTWRLGVLARRARAGVGMTKVAQRSMRIKPALTTTP